MTKLFNFRAGEYAGWMTSNPSVPVNGAIESSDIVEALKFVIRGNHSQGKGSFYYSVVLEDKSSGAEYTRGVYTSAKAGKDKRAEQLRRDSEVANDGLTLDIDRDSLHADELIELFKDGRLMAITRRAHNFAEWQPLEKIAETS